MKSHCIKLSKQQLYKRPLIDMPSFRAVFIDEAFDVKGHLNEFVVFDTETTGLNPETDSIIQLSAIKYRNLHASEKWDTYINPNCSISPQAF